MAKTLTSSYQYIGRSSPMTSNNGKLSYYLLLYAKTSPNQITGIHTVTIKSVLASTITNATYYAKSDYTQQHNGKINGSTAFSGKNKPSEAWELSSFTANGVSYKTGTLLGEGSVNVDCTNGQEKDIKISCYYIFEKGKGDSYTPANGTERTVSATVTLSAIPRASTITSAAGVTLGENCNVTWTPQASSFRYKLKFSIGDWSETTGIIYPNKTTAYTYTEWPIPIDVANYVPGKTGTMTVTLYTYSDSNATNQMGSADSETFTVTVPENEATSPTVSMSLSPVNELPAPFDSLYIQGKSKVKATLEFGLKYGATVDESNITVGGVVYGNPYESGYLTESVSVKGFVKDSRGHTDEVYQDITVIPYSKPIVQAASGESNIVATRCDENGNSKDSGTYLKIKAKLIYEKVVSDRGQNNFGKIQYRYKSESGLWSEWRTILDSESTTETEVNTGAVPNVGLSIKTNYQVQVKAIDNLEESLPITLSVPSDNVYMDRPAGGDGMGLGGYCSGNGNFDVYWKIKARGGLSLFNEWGEEIPADEILPFPRGTLGEGWNPDNISNGVYEVNIYPLKDHLGNVLMENGVLIQLAATINGSVLLQLAFPTDSHAPVYRLRWNTNWSDWTTF